MHVRSTVPIALVLLLAACVHGAQRNPMAIWVPSENHDLRRPSLIVLHATAEDSLQRSLELLRSPGAGARVSAHYLIARDGRLYQLVADQHRAWHAGAGSWGSLHDVNSASIGIELDNNGLDEPFPDVQIETLLRLLDDLALRWRIPPANVIAHSDMAPARKRDPGPRFPWRRLAQAGYGLWPGETTDVVPPADFDPIQALARIGYPVTDPQAAVRAFRLRFRAATEGELDEEDRRILFLLDRDIRSSSGGGLGP